MNSEQVGLESLESLVEAGDGLCSPHVSKELVHHSGAKTEEWRPGWRAEVVARRAPPPRLEPGGGGGGLVGDPGGAVCQVGCEPG